jgi:RNA polymerase sigma factor (sigma-70 family)
MTAQPADRSPPSADAAAPLLATQELLRRAQEGNPEARDQLRARYLPRLRRWANGRLPMYARSLVDTVDIVQDILIRVFQSLDGIEVRGPGGFEAYVRRAVNNRIRDEIARAAHRPRPEGVLETLRDPGPSPLENAVGAGSFWSESDTRPRVPKEVSSCPPGRKRASAKSASPPAAVVTQPATTSWPSGWSAVS